jgi:hypothetical protein
MTAETEDSERDWLELVREKVQSLRFGVVQIVVHDSKVTQIERTEKTRLDGAAAPRKSFDSGQTTGGRHN